MTIECKIKEVLLVLFGTCNAYVYVVNFEPFHMPLMSIVWEEM